MRAKTLSRKPAERWEAGGKGYWGFGASILGPVFTGFAEWVHARAEAERVGTVYCAMREGEFLSSLLNQAGPYLGSPVEARSVWLSRQVCSRAAIAEATVEELSDFLVRRVETLT